MFSLNQTNLQILSNLNPRTNKFQPTRSYQNDLHAFENHPKSDLSLSEIDPPRKKGVNELTSYICSDTSIVLWFVVFFFFFLSSMTTA